jgi:hypothetical protein
MRETSQSSLKFLARGMITYHENRETNAKQNPISAKNPNIIMRLYNPRRKRNAHCDLLTAIRVPIFLEVFPNVLVGKSAARLDQVNLMDYCVRFIGFGNLDEACGHEFSCIIGGELHFVRMTV